MSGRHRGPLASPSHIPRAFRPRPRGGAVVRLLMTLLVLGGLGTAGYLAYGPAATVAELIQENKSLQQALTRLGEERQIGYAKVAEQFHNNGQLMTRLRFVATDPRNPQQRLLERNYEIAGDIVHFDALVVRFDKQLVQDGKARSLYLWRRVYGENMTPADGLSIETPGQEPLRYKGLFEPLWPQDKQLFWRGIWDLANAPDKLKEHGIQAIFGNVVYSRLQPGLIYIFKIDAAGNLYPETVPDL